MSDAGGDKTTGHNASDVAVMALKRLGPTTIVVAGLLVLGYFLYAEINSARETADKQLAESLYLAQNQLIENTSKMGDMSAQLIKNIENILELNTKVDKAIAAAWAKVEEAKEQLVRSQAAEETAWKQIVTPPTSTPEAFTAQAISDRADIMILTDALSAAQAKALITIILPKFPNTALFVAAQYPDAVRDADTDGSKAKMLLRRMVAMSALTSKGREKWRTAIASL